MSRFEVRTEGPETGEGVAVACRYDSAMTPSLPQDEILEFWFGPAPHAERDAWFRKDPTFDAEIRSRFGAAIESALAGGWPRRRNDAARFARARAPARPVHAQRVPRHDARLRG